MRPDFRQHGACRPRSHDKQSSFRDLKVWRDAMTLVEEVYKLSARFPSEERFGLTSQIRRAAVSIPSNIGEGKRQRAFLNHLDIALGSQGELEVQLEIAQRLGFVARKDIGPVMNRVAEVGRMLNGLIESLQPDQTERM
jgi:four helix bundle protein